MSEIKNESRPWSTGGIVIRNKDGREIGEFDRDEHAAMAVQAVNRDARVRAFVLAIRNLACTLSHNVWEGSELSNATIRDSLDEALEAFDGVNE